MRLTEMDNDQALIGSPGPGRGFLFTSNISPWINPLVRLCQSQSCWNTFARAALIFAEIAACLAASPVRLGRR
jgi:hypothetical protein